MPRSRQSCRVGLKVDAPTWRVACLCCAGRCNFFTRRVNWITLILAFHWQSIEQSICSDNERMILSEKEVFIF